MNGDHLALERLFTVLGLTLRRKLAKHGLDPASACPRTVRGRIAHTSLRVERSSVLEDLVFCSCQV
jgi:hypothetical protein